MLRTAICIPVLIQQNVDRSNFFNRSWAEYKVGFNSTNGNYWIGNDLLSQLTLSGNYKLRIELQARDDSSLYWAEYSRFIVLGESSNYRLQVSGHSGNIGGNGFSYHNGMMFTTYDRDNDPWINGTYNDNCAVFYGGGFWYKACSRCNVNAVRDRALNIIWWSQETGRLYMKSSRMWLTC